MNSVTSIWFTQKTVQEVKPYSYSKISYKKVTKRFQSFDIDTNYEIE